MVFPRTTTTITEEEDKEAHLNSTQTHLDEDELSLIISSITGNTDDSEWIHSKSTMATKIQAETKRRNHCSITPEYDLGSKVGHLFLVTYLLLLLLQQWFFCYVTLRLHKGIISWRIKISSRCYATHEDLRYISFF